MPPRRHRRPRFDPDERFNLPDDTDPREAVRRLLGVEGNPAPVESHEEAEDPDKQDEATNS